MSRLLTLILAAALCGGCAYNNAISRGDQQFGHGNYERAVDAYQQAVLTKPDAIKAQQKLAIAQQKLDIWAAQIATAARRADNNQLPALAAALYQKQAQLKGDTQAAARAAQLRRQLSRAYTPLVYLKGAPQLLASTSTPLEKYSSAASNHLRIQVSASQPQFNTEAFESSGSHQYVSGTITRSNPHYLALQDELQALHHKLEQLQDKKHRQKLKLDREEHQMASLKGSLQEQQNNLQNSEPQSQQYLDSEHRINELKESIQYSKSKLKSLRAKLKDSRHYIDQCQAEYAQLEYELAETPDLIIEDAYATYQYPLTEVLQTAELTLSFRHNGQVSSDTVVYQYSDLIFNGNTQVGMEPDPREPISEAQMREHLNELAAQRVAQQVGIARAEYRQRLLDSALGQVDQQGKLDGLIRYALSGSQRLEPNIRQRTNRLLRAEYGTAGNLDIVGLLKL